MDFTGESSKRIGLVLVRFFELWLLLVVLSNILPSFRLLTVTLMIEIPNDKERVLIQVDQ